MVGPWPYKPYTFRALAKTLGPLWVRCDVCRRYARLHIGPDLREADYRTKTFSCSRCGASAAVCVVEPTTERGMEDYRLDEVERPQHHPAAIDRLSGHRSRFGIDWSAGELPGRKLDESSLGLSTDETPPSVSL
jgi:hypothetical protein